MPKSLLLPGPFPRHFLSPSPGCFPWSIPFDPQSHLLHTKGPQAVEAFRDLPTSAPTHTLHIAALPGAQLMSVINKDENKTFGATFRTPVDDSKGTPHILEHSVLCGSDKYPIKEPFVELMKGSLNTFLNAFTYPDRTCYPVASANLRDFYNLVDVYLDSVLHPNCVSDPQIFAQEGWHYELEGEAEPLTLKGVVFNEMKGVYSSPDSVNARVTQAALHPDSTYAKDSGGDPEAIPTLTFDGFKVRWGLVVVVVFCVFGMVGKGH